MLETTREYQERTILMANLIFEIWHCDDSGSTELSDNADRLRKRTCPNATKLFEVSAVSDHEAVQKHYDFLGFGSYDPGQFPNRFFTRDEEVEQQGYLATRRPWIDQDGSNG